MSKISALTELAEAPASTDEFVIVDKSDTTMATTGTTKRIQSQYVTIADASTTVKGKVELLTDAETITGADTTRAMTASNLTAKMDTDGTLAGNLDTRIPSQKAVKTYGDRALNTLLTRIPLYAPQGFLINGKISVTDAAGITVAIKTLAGTDPSATDPVYVRIGDTVRTISAALSVVLADGTNWMNLGSAELATKEVDLFAKLGYNATDGVVLAFSRYPGGNQYSDWSTTTTNEKYMAVSTRTNAASTDYYEVIGRFAATLSAGAGYTWSVPTYTAINLIQRPIYETRLLDWVPTTSASSGTYTTTSLSYAKYKVSGSTVKADIVVSGTTSSTPQNIRASLPFTSARDSFGSGYSTDSTATVSEIVFTGAAIYSYLSGFVNYSAGVSRVLRASGEYEI